MESNERVRDELVLVGAGALESICGAEGFDQRRFDECVTCVEGFDFVGERTALAGAVVDFVFKLFLAAPNPFSGAFVQWGFARLLCDSLETGADPAPGTNSLGALESKTQFALAKRISEGKEARAEGEAPGALRRFAFRREFLLEFLGENREKIRLESLTGPEALRLHSRRLRGHLTGPLSGLSPEALAQVEDALDPKSDRETVRGALKCAAFVSRNLSRPFAWLRSEIAKAGPLLARVDSALLRSVFEEKLSLESLGGDWSALERFEICSKALAADALELKAAGLWEALSPLCLEKAARLIKGVRPGEAEAANWDKKVYRVLDAGLEDWDRECGELWPLLRRVADLALPENAAIHGAIACEPDWVLPPRFRLKYLFCRNHFPRLFSFRILGIEKNGHSLHLDQILAVLQ